MMETKPAKMLKARQIETLRELNEFIRVIRPVFITGSEPYTVIYEVEAPRTLQNKGNVYNIYSKDPA
ncbi:MAG: hypothetical protein NC124_02460 [Clostridium sp.]|nr:hypothetical protein [Clostridium sp.]